MTQEIEIEFKNLLTEDEYSRVYHFLPFKSVELIEQTNYYFETEDLKLKQHGAALRIRKKSDQWTLTLKQPHPEGLLETHDILSEQEANLWIQNKLVEKSRVFRQLRDLGIDPEQLHYLGSLTTRRKELEYNGALVVLDHSLYYDQEDYELEVEAGSRESGKSVIQEILQSCNIPERETDNKIKRFYKAKLKSE
ncbi:CYTH domain-containing protein [Halobacillus litoralis]|uniref:CYTH domain-containing protein n=1 Tax=Halobacillus litoralis TaxID=45668 RepID=A0A845DWL4_9BACI|nr:MULTISPECIES: CYTH domain-containing protein [Halobacillus]MYL18467.1 CYTH domain-containing protein [Halobacillus litoralis]MYL30527.1 CYTH domain-containing protein [Halobacillus halophilus]MYL38894.1 CYTH domain-containing protein [Halobacillus litoralis]